jgi:cytochrome c oxidase subunit 1
VVITAPFSVLGVNLLASLWRARMRFETPALFALAVISAVGFGGFGGLFLGTMTSDVYFHDTYFVVGHFHLMIGTVTLLSIFGATYYWFPKMFGRRMDERLGRWHFWLTAVPMISIFVLMHMQGLGGMLRRTFDPSQYEYNQAMNSALRLPITLLAFVLFAAQAIFLWNFGKSLLRGAPAPANPWRATTLEWQLPSPPPHGNFGDALPVVHRWPYEYSPGPGQPDALPQTAEKTA